jgi:hypothetical protein
MENELNTSGSYERIESIEKQDLDSQYTISTTHNSSTTSQLEGIAKVSEVQPIGKYKTTKKHLYEKRLKVYLSRENIKFESVQYKGEYSFLYFKEGGFGLISSLSGGNAEMLPLEGKSFSFEERPDISKVESKDVIYEEVLTLVRDYTGQSDKYAHLLATLVLLSYQQDKFNILPSCQIFGPSGSLKTPMLLILNELAYRARFQTSMTAANIHEFCNKSDGFGRQLPTCVTILEDEVDSIKNEKLTIFKSDTRWHTVSRMITGNGVRDQKTNHTFCLKIIAGENLVGDAALKRRSIKIQTLGTAPKKNIYKVHEEDEKEFNNLRCKLLVWAMSGGLKAEELQVAHPSFAEYTNYWEPILITASNTSGHKILLEYFTNELERRGRQKKTSIKSIVSLALEGLQIDPSNAVEPFRIIWDKVCEVGDAQELSTKRFTMLLYNGEELSTKKLGQILEDDFGGEREVVKDNGKAVLVYKFDSETFHKAMSRFKF